MTILHKTEHDRIKLRVQKGALKIFKRATVKQILQNIGGKLAQYLLVSEEN